MEKLTKYVLIILLVGGNNLFSQLTLEDCHQKAKNNYPLIKQYDLIERSQEYSLSNAGKSYLPQLSITAIGGVIDGFPEFSLPGQEASSNKYNLISLVQLKQNIWDGGITSANKSIIAAESAIEKADLEIAMYALEDRVNNLFFGTLLITEQINQLTLLKENLERNLKVIQIAVDNGTAYKSDLNEIKVEILNAEQKIAELNYNKLAYVEMLSAIIGGVISNGDVFLRPDHDNSYQAHTINRPELSMFENQRMMMEARSDLSGTNLYPKIGLIGVGVFVYPGISFGTSDLSRLLVGGLSLSWEIGGLYTNSNQNELTKIGLNKINTQQETFLFNTNLELSKTNAEIEKFKSLIIKDKEILKLKSDIKKSYEVKYDNGVSTMSKLLDSINDENVASQILIMHEIQYLMAVNKYKNVSGN